MIKKRFKVLNNRPFPVAQIEAEFEVFKEALQTNNDHELVSGEQLMYAGEFADNHVEEFGVTNSTGDYVFTEAPQYTRQSKDESNLCNKLPPFFKGSVLERVINTFPKYHSWKVSRVDGTNGTNIKPSPDLINEISKHNHYRIVIPLSSTMGQYMTVTKANDIYFQDHIVSYPVVPGQAYMIRGTDEIIILNTITSSPIMFLVGEHIK